MNAPDDNNATPTEAPPVLEVPVRPPLTDTVPAPLTDVLPPLVAPPLPLPTLPEGARCVQHPHLQAIQRCARCGAFSCATCDFTLANHTHICPACAAAPRSALGPTAKKLVIGSFAAAVWTTFGMAGVVSGAFAGMAQTRQEQMLLGFVLILFVVGPAIAGVSMAYGAKRPNRATPASLWIALIWNALMIGSFILMMLVNVFRNR